jgi:hypothetical protein
MLIQINWVSNLFILYFSSDFNLSWPTKHHWLHLPCVERIKWSKPSINQRINYFKEQFEVLTKQRRTSPGWTWTRLKQRRSFLFLKQDVYLP